MLLGIDLPQGPRAVLVLTFEYSLYRRSLEPSYDLMGSLWTPSPLEGYRGYSKLRTRTAPRMVLSSLA